MSGLVQQLSGSQEGLYFMKVATIIHKLQSTKGKVNTDTGPYSFVILQIK
jgi:hypothetical protein